MENDYKFDLNQFEILNQIGQGAFGIVYKVKEKKTENIYVAKISIMLFDEDAETSKSMLINSVREISIISKLNHPAIVKFIGFSSTDFEGNFKPTIITEFIPNGSLKSIMDQEKKGRPDYKWTDTRKLVTLYGIASAMAYLHSHNIIHRDLKPENILMDDELYPKITDFGLSKIVHQNQDSMTMASMIGFKGTILYSPPETIFDNDYSKAGDVYAFAMIAYEIISNEVPFNNCTIKNIIQKLAMEERPKFDSTVNEAYKKLIEKCWSQEPSKRPTFDQIANDIKENQAYITKLIEPDDFYHYIDYIDEYKTSFDSLKSIVSIDSFIQKKKKVSKIAEKVQEINKESSIEKVHAINKESSTEKVHEKNHESTQNPKLNIKAINEWNKFYYDKNAQMDKKQASIVCKMAADSGIVIAMRNYSLMLLNGDGIPIDKAESLRYCKMAADNGEVNSIYDYALMLFNGDGVPVDKITASEYFKKGAEKGHIKCHIAYQNIEKGDTILDINNPINCKLDKKQQLNFKNLHQYLNDQNDDNSMNISAILPKFKMSEIDILIQLSYSLKLTPKNCKIISNNSKSFKKLNEACELYEKIIDNSEYKKQNFINIFILNYLLTNLDSSNIEMYSIYANLFIYDIDLPSFYQIIITHCIGNPNSIYYIACFLSKYNNISNNNELIKKSLFTYNLRYLGRWEIRTLEYFLDCFNLVPVDMNSYHDIILKTMKSKLLQIKYFDFKKCNSVFDPLYKCILNNDIDEFNKFLSNSDFDLNGSIINSPQTDIYWPFTGKTKISFINLAAFSGSFNIFKKLLSNHAKIDNDLIDYAIASGNSEIIEMCENICRITLNSIEFSIRYYRTNVFLYILKNYKQLIQDNNEKIFEFTFKYSNAAIFSIMVKEGFKPSISKSFLFTCLGKEWIKFLASIHSFHPKVINYLKAKIIYKYSELNEHISYPLEYYFQTKGELDKYENKLLISPFPNELIFKQLGKENRLIFKKKFSYPFLLFLIDNEVIKFKKNVNLDFIFQNAITNNDYEFLNELEKYDSKVPQYVSKYIFTNWRDFVRVQNLSKKKYFFDKIIKDVEQNLDFQTEGLVYACQYNDIETLQILLSKTYININIRNHYFSQNSTLLLTAAAQEFIKIVYLLSCDKRIHINAYINNDYNYTIFAYACANNLYDIVYMLLNNEKVDINIPEDSLPIFIAQKRRFYEVVNLILDDKKERLKILFSESNPKGLSKKQIENYVFFSYY